MIDALLFGLLILALLGWGGTVVLFARSILPMMNGFKVAHDIDARFDKRVTEILDRAKANTKPPVIPSGKPQDQAQKIQDELRTMFGGPPSPPLIPAMGFEDQPDAQTETISA